MGCEYGQGFLFSKAVRADQAESLLLHGFASREGLSLPTESAEGREDEKWDVAGIRFNTRNSESSSGDQGESSHKGANGSLWD